MDSKRLDVTKQPTNHQSPTRTRCSSLGITIFFGFDRTVCVKSTYLKETTAILPLLHDGQASITSINTAVKRHLTTEVDHTKSRGETRPPLDHRGRNQSLSLFHHLARHTLWIDDVGIHSLSALDHRQSKNRPQGRFAAATRANNDTAHSLVQGFLQLQHLAHLRHVRKRIGRGRS